LSTSAVCRWIVRAIIAASTIQVSLRCDAGLSVPLPPRSGGEGSGVGGLLFDAATPPTPDPSPPFATQMGGRGARGRAAYQQATAYQQEGPKIRIRTAVRHCRA
jgi:hypothetical protein